MEVSLSHVLPFLFFKSTLVHTGDKMSPGRATVCERGRATARRRNSDALSADSMQPKTRFEY